MLISLVKARSRATYCLLALLLTLTGLIGLMPSQAKALELSSRSLAIDDPRPGATTRHTFRFTNASTGTPLGSIVFEYCTNVIATRPCNAPAGVDASGAVLASQSGETGFSIFSANSNRIVLTRGVATPPNASSVQYSFTGIVNPNGVPDTFYARISTYTSNDGTGFYTDFGAVVNSTTQRIQINGEVPPYLKFCVGLVITGDCSSAEGNLVDLGDLTTAFVASGTSMMQASTNADFGLVIAAYGTTMTSGTNVIPALAAPTVSAPGNAQFGLNLRNNTNPNVGQDPGGGGIANPTPNYNIVDRFTFNSGDTIATSPVATDTRTFTVSYIANIAPSQAPGLYTATLTYICSASF